MKFKNIFSLLLVLAISCAPIALDPLFITTQTVTTTNQTNQAYAIAQINSSNNSMGNFGLIREMTYTGSAINSDFVLHKGPLAYVANGGVLVIDTKTHEEVAQLSLKYGAEQVALSPDDAVLYAVAGGKQYVEGIGYIDQSFLTLINTTTNKEMGYVDLGYNVYSKQVAVGPDGKVYISWQKVGTQYPGYTVFDFKKNLRWDKQFGEYNEYLALSFAFNSDGSRAFMGMLNPRASIYDLHWDENMAYINTIYPKMTALRAITATKNAQTIYYVAWEAEKIGYMRNSDGNLQIWKEDYVPTDLVYSIDDSALYVVGTKNGVPKLYKITGLLGISTVGAGGTENFITEDPSSFYYASQSATLTLPSGTIPGHIALTPGGKYAYITNIKADPYYESNGDTVVVYDTQTLQKVATIKTGSVNRFSDIAIAKGAVVWDPAPEFSVISGITVNSQIDVHALIVTPYVVERTPASGSENAQLNARISVTYSREIDPKTVNESTFIVLNSHYYPIEGEMGASGNVAYFIPSGNYTKNSQVFVALTDRITDTNGTPAAWDYYNFSTGNGTLAFIGGMGKIELGAKNAFRITEKTPELQLKARQFTAAPSIPPNVLRSIGNITGNQTVGSQPNAKPTQGPVEIPEPKKEVSGPKEEETQGVIAPQPGSDVSINPQPEPPGQNSIFDSIVGFFKGLFGLN